MLIKKLYSVVKISKLKIWMDSCTTKQSRIACSLSTEFDKLGYDYYITARDIDYNYSYLKQVFKIDFYPVGRLGHTREEKLLIYTERVKELTEIILEKEGKPDVVTSLTSPGAARVAFGLKIPIITYSDTPHAFAVWRLTMPLTTYALIPISVPKESALKWGVKEENLYIYDGVDELAWTKNAKYDRDVPKELNLTEDDHYCIFRPDEAVSSYFMDNPDLSPKLPVNALIVKKVIENYPDHKIVVFPRYKEQTKYFKDQWGSKIIIPKKAVDTISLMKFADLVVSGGGTMTRESALIGTPSVNCVQLDLLDPDRYLQNHGLPLFYEPNIEKAADLTVKILKNPDKYRIKDTSKILENMESLNDVILRILEEKF
ncbi:MAG: DUF354 domain-containing protein [Candidatus Lokiarchaeota archaeon]|nr:DUF354 domain-containing protein [Candidatus Lokiarchaeota archaeon]